MVDYFSPVLAVPATNSPRERYRSNNGLPIINVPHFRKFLALFPFWRKVGNRRICESRLLSFPATVSVRTTEKCSTVPTPAPQRRPACSSALMLSRATVCVSMQRTDCACAPPTDLVRLTPSKSRCFPFGEVPYLVVWCSSAM